MTTLHVACAAEGAEYVAHSAAMINSLLSRHPRDSVHVHYAPGPDVSRAQEERLAEMVARDGGRISFLRVPYDRVEGLAEQDFTKATWYRVFLPDLLPRLDRILYLDCDLLVRDSLQPLFDLDLGRNWIAAVTNVFMPYHAHRPGELGLKDPERYFNAGVAVMNLDAMRRKRLSQKVLRYGRQNAERVGWRDQDALNIVLGRRRLRLHPRWNVMNSFAVPEAVRVFGEAALREALERPAVRHFEGPAENKPWHPGNRSDMRDAYAEHRSRTPWPLSA